MTFPLGFKAGVGSALFALCGGECNVHSLRSTYGATHCRPLDGQHCGALTRFISCPRILSVAVVTGAGVEPRIAGFLGRCLSDCLFTAVFHMSCQPLELFRNLLHDDTYGMYKE